MDRFLYEDVCGKGRYAEEGISLNGWRDVGSWFPGPLTSTSFKALNLPDFEAFLFLAENIARRYLPLRLFPFPLR